MANEHIGRKQQIGIGKESVAGTSVSAALWIPKASGQFAPRHESAVDESAYGVIDGLYDQQTVKNMTIVELEAILGDSWVGHLLTAAFGLSYPCIKIPVSSVSGNFVEGETITETDSSATGTLRRTDEDQGSSPALYIVPVSGTFTGGKALTGGTSSATATGGAIESQASLRNHVFRRANNNNHPSYTLYGKDDVSDEFAAYCMLDTLDLEVVVGDFARVRANFMGKKLGSASSTPSYTAQNNFLAKFAAFKTATNFNGLNAASAVGIERMSLSIKKNLADYQAFGDTDVASIHNQRFDVEGSITAIYNATTFRDFITDSEKRAMRLTLANTDVTIGSAANPMIQFDFPKVSFNEWSRTPDNDTLVKQSFNFKAEYEPTRGVTAEAILQNTNVTGY
jgi:hypothetical protein